MTLNKKIDYIGREYFVKYTNALQVSALSEKLRNFLAQTGFYNRKKRFPFMEIEGVLKEAENGLVEIGVNDVDDKFYIDTQNDERIIYINSETNQTYVVNSSIERFIECIYIAIYFHQEIELEEVYGSYAEKHLKYAKEMRKMFDAVEGNIDNYPLWAAHVTERENGAM